MGRVRGGTWSGQQVRIGAPDESVTAVSGLVAVSELCGQLGVIEALDGAVGSIKQRARGHSAGALLVGLAAAQLAGEDHLVGLDGAGQALVPVTGLGSTTAAGLARRISTEQWAAVETGVATVTGRMLARLPHRRREALLAWRDDRSGHHRCGGLWPQETRGGLQLPRSTLRAPTRGQLG